MTIKEELKLNYQKAINAKKEQETKEEQKLQNDATVFIKQFILPEFKKINEMNPTLSLIEISFYANCGCWYYYSSIDDWENHKDSSYKYQVVRKAVEIAEKFDVEAFEKSDNGGGTTLTFRLDLNS